MSLHVTLVASTEELVSGDQAADEAGKAFDHTVGCLSFVKDGEFWEAGENPRNLEDADWDDEIWVDDGKLVTHESTHYEFRIRKPVAETRELVCSLAREGVESASAGSDWTRSLRVEIWSLKAELFRVGNAD